jgi:hypothetical protein
LYRYLAERESVSAVFQAIVCRRNWCGISDFS